MNLNHLAQPHTYEAPFDSVVLRQVFGSFATGVAVITTQDGNETPYGLTVSSFNTVSLDPPLILWSQSKHAGSHSAFYQTERFAISILAEHQTDISNHFSSRLEDKFATLEADLDYDFCGLPVIRDSRAWLHCHTVSRIDGGDHTIYLAQVLKTAHCQYEPLIFFSGRYVRTQQ